MPRGDGTGPYGCGCGCGHSMRRGFRGYGFRSQITLTKEDEKKILEAELKEIEDEKQDIRKRLEEKSND